MLSVCFVRSASDSEQGGESDHQGEQAMIQSSVQGLYSRYSNSKFNHRYVRR